MLNSEREPSGVIPGGKGEAYIVLYFEIHPIDTPFQNILYSIEFAAA
jgi:hypothetical protein